MCRLCSYPAISRCTYLNLLLQTSTMNQLCIGNQFSNSDKEDNKFTTTLSNINVVFGGVTSNFAILALGGSRFEGPEDVLKCHF